MKNPYYLFIRFIRKCLISAKHNLSSKNYFLGNKIRLSQKIISQKILQRDFILQIIFFLNNYFPGNTVPLFIFCFYFFNLLIQHSTCWHCKMMFLRQRDNRAGKQFNFRIPFCQTILPHGRHTIWI